MKASRLLASIVLIMLARAGQAQGAPVDSVFPPARWGGRAVFLPAVTFRNGDWFAVGAASIFAVSPRTCGRYLVATSRAEVGIGGANAAFGLATNLAEAPCELDKALMDSGLVGFEVRVARMYGPTAWHRTEYVGAQVSIAMFAMARLTLGVMVDAHDHRERHNQLGIGILF